MAKDRDMAPEPITVTLGSCTVFDYDLTRVKTSKDMDALEVWLKENAKHDWRIWREGVWFCDANDAALCRLWWG